MKNWHTASPYFKSKEQWWRWTLEVLRLHTPREFNEQAKSIMQNSVFAALIEAAMLSEKEYS